MKDNEGNLVVVKANKLIQQFKFSLSAAEMQVVNFIIANINSPLYDEEFNTMEFEITDFYKMMGIDNPGGSSYEYIKRVIQGLRNKTSNYIDFGEYETIVSWIEKPKFYKKKGKVVLKLDDDLKPYLLKANGIMKSQLKYYFEMESKYSMRLYELLKSWDGYNKMVFEVEKLRLSMDAIKKSYEKWSAFETFALAPAVKEINEITDLNVRYETTKQGRGGKVVSVTFFYNYKPDMKPVKKIVDAAEDPEQVEGQINIAEYPGVVPEQEEEYEDYLTPEERKEEELRYWEKAYGYLESHLINITRNKDEIKSIYNLVKLNAFGDDFFYTDQVKQELIVGYIRSSVLKIEATLGKTKTTHYDRLYDMLERKIEEEKTEDR